MSYGFVWGEKGLPLPDEAFPYHQKKNQPEPLHLNNIITFPFVWGSVAKMMSTRPSPGLSVELINEEPDV